MLPYAVTEDQLGIFVISRSRGLAPWCTAAHYCRLFLLPSTTYLQLPFTRTLHSEDQSTALPLFLSSPAGAVRRSGDTLSSHLKKDL